MKTNKVTALLISGTLVLVLFLINLPARSQVTSPTGTALPDEVNKIVTTSCMPCHSSQGGLMSKAKLNFTEWAKYSPAKQKEKAAKIYSEINKGSMPPKMAREKRPEIIPTKDQAEIIKKWSDSFTAETK